MSRIEYSEAERLGAAQSLALGLLLFDPGTYGIQEYDAFAIFTQVSEKLTAYTTRSARESYPQDRFSVKNMKIALRMGGTSSENLGSSSSSARVTAYCMRKLGKAVPSLRSVFSMGLF